METRTFSELRTEGLLWYINRVAFHPHGLALAFDFDDDSNLDVDEPNGWKIMVANDGLWAFPEEMDNDGSMRYRNFLLELLKDKDEL